jgi:hypothetical protein
MEINLQEDSQP